MQATLPIINTAETLFKQTLPFTLHSDSNSAIAAFKSGYSRKMRHLKKNQRVSVAFVADSMDEIEGKVVREDSEHNNADLHTKALDRILYQRHREALGVKCFK